MAENIREHMTSGRWFEAGDVQLDADRRHAQETMIRFNSDTSLIEEDRTDILRSLLGSLGEGSVIMPGAWIDYGYNIHIGDHCFFNFGCIFLDGGLITFGNDVWVGPRVTFATPLHPLLPDERRKCFDSEGKVLLCERNESISVGNDVWIASGVTVNPGVTIGDGAVVASGSVVTKDIPARTLARGIPCKPIREITATDSIREEDSW